jgi:hypothetical protein
MLILRKLLLSLVVSGLCSASLEADVLTGVDPTIINIGTGPDLSYLVIDESTLYSTPLEFIYHYTYDSNNLLTGTDLLQQVASNSTLGVSMVFYGGGLGNSLDSLTYAGTTVAGTNAPDYSTGSYWSYYVAGGLEAGTPAATNDWSYSSVGWDSRTISPGSWDGETLSSYSDYGSTTTGLPPSVAIVAVPEPETAPLMLLSIITLLLLLRWKSSERNSTL